MISRFLWDRFKVSLTIKNNDEIFYINGIRKLKNPGTKSSLLTSPETNVGYSSEKTQTFYIYPKDKELLEEGYNIIHIGTDNYENNPFVIKYIHPNAYRLGSAMFYVIECENDRKITLSEGGIL
jgi:hypothetical protein